MYRFRMFLRSIIPIFLVPVAIVFLLMFFKASSEAGGTYGFRKAMGELLNRNWYLEQLLTHLMALGPLVAARSRYVESAVSSAIRNMAFLAGFGKGQFCAARRLLLAARKPLVRVTRYLLLFWSTNLILDLVCPDDVEIAVAPMWRFIDLNGDGKIEAAEFDSFIYDRSSKVFVALATTELAGFLAQAKRIPKCWVQNDCDSLNSNFLCRYWNLLTHGSGWWQLFDKALTVGLILFAVYPWCAAVGVSFSALLAFGGVGGLALGLAAQEMVKNIVSFVIISVTAPFRIGDRIRTGHADVNFYTGCVKKIGWNSTLVDVEDDDPQANGSKMVYLRNSQLLEWPLIVYKHGGQTSKDTRG